MSAEPKPNLSAMKEPSNTKPILGKRKSTEPSCGELDSRIKRLRDSILPTSPYLLTVPSDGPPLGSSHQPNYWRKGTPFAANEERLQYLSFLAHGDGLIKAVGGWDNDKGEIMETTSKQLQSRSSGMSGSQQTQSQKKKISLSDYKTKAGGQAVTKDVTKANGTSGQRQMNGTLQTTENLAKAEKNDLILSQKRSSEALDDNKASKAPPNRQNSPPPAKKLRTTPPPSKQEVKDEPKVNKPNTFVFPTLLSPTLPSSIERELAKLVSTEAATKHEKSNSLASVISDKHFPSSQPSSPAGAAGPMKAKVASAITKPIPDQVSKRPSAEKTQHSKTSSREKDAQPSGVAGLASLPPSSANAARKEPASSSSTKPENTKLSMVVKLRFPKGRRKDVVRLLQMKPASTINANSVPKEDEKDPSVKSTLVGKVGPITTEQKPVVLGSTRISEVNGKTFKDKRTEDKSNSQHEISKAVEKRRRVEDDSDSRASTNKRQKPENLELSQKPRTPVPPPFKSPSLSQHGSAQKSQVTTPMRDIKSSAMRRVESGDGDVRTPHGSQRNGTPTGFDKVNREGKSTANTSSNTGSLSARQNEVNAWKAEHAKYTDLGKALKRDADFVLKNRDEAKIKTPAGKRAMVVAIETALCYIIAFTASDEASRLSRKTGDPQHWRSLLPYINAVKSVTGEHSVLHGFCLQLEAIFREIVHIHDLDRLEKELVPGATIDDSTAPIAKDNTGNSTSDSTSKVAQSRKDYIDFKGRMIENARSAHICWIEGSSELPIAQFQRAFPETWKKKAQSPLAKSKEKCTPGKYAGDFYLPLSSVTTAMEAVRVGWSLLGEWCAKEGVKWEGKLGL